MFENKEVFERIRNSFLDINEQNCNKFHSTDVERVKSNDWWIERFVMTTKSEDSALKALVKCMEWRKSFGVNDFTDDYFPEEFYRIGWFSQYCKDKEDRPVVWNQMKRLHICYDIKELMEQFMVYQFEKVDNQTTHGGWALVIDPIDATFPYLDMNFGRFIPEVLQDYYPLGPKYMLIMKLPGVPKPTITLLKTFINEQLNSIVKYIKHTDELDHIDRAYIPVHLNGSYDRPLTCIPEGVKPMEQLPHIHLTTDQLKKVYSTFEPYLK